jgi:multicomponent Na+:H+ antiporter subunit E
MKRRIALRLTVLCWLTLVWLLLWGRISVANIIGGLAVALVITIALPMPVVPVQGLLHPIALTRLVVRLLWWLAQSSVQVAWLAIRPGPPPRSAVLRARLAVKSDLVLALAVNAINLIPGTLVLEIDQDRRLLYIHVLDVGSDRAVDGFYRQIAELEWLLVAAFERDTEWLAIEEVT